MSTSTNPAAVEALAAAVVGVLPVPAPLQPAEPTALPTGATSSSVQLPAGAGAAIVARVVRPGGTVAGSIAVVVASDLVEALKDSPLGALDVAAAVQPALDAGAQALGLTAERGTELPIDVALDGIVSTGSACAVPLLDAAGTLISTLVVSLSDAEAPAGGGAMPRARGLELLRGVEMEVTVELGRTRMTVRELLSLSPGAVVELDRAAGSPADLLVNGTLIARGEVVVVDEDFGIRITEIVSTTNETSGKGSAA